MRRVAPRPLAAALGQIVRQAEPDTKLARIQALWPAVVGGVVAARARPVAERAGALTVACESAVWAQELELLGADLVTRLNAGLGPGVADPVERLRLVVGSVPNDS